MKFRGNIAAFSAILIFGFYCPISFAEDLERGRRLYSRCAACHLPSGKGIEGAFPALKNRLGQLSGYVEGRDYLVMVVQKGLIGQIKVDGKIYYGAMPAQGLTLSNEEMSDLLNFVLISLNTETLPKDWSPFLPQEIEATRKRYSNISAAGVKNLRDGAFLLQSNPDAAANEE